MKVRNTADIIADVRAVLDTAEVSRLPDAELRCMLAWALSRRAGEARVFSSEPRRVRGLAGPAAQRQTPERPMIILGLDMSSTAIGFCVLRPTEPLWGTALLDGGIAERCAAARAEVARLLDNHAPALVVIESPVARFVKAVLPQARVSGAVLSLLAERRALWEEVSPATAKQVLTGSGSAGKAEMVRAAADRIGLVWKNIATVRGKVWALDGRDELLSEDEADAYALALCGAAMRVVTKGAA